MPEIEALPAPPSQITVVAIANGGNGRGYDLTEEVEGLTYSNVEQGGDEVCTFLLRRSAFASSPDIARGNLLRICNGIDVLWQGRIEETDRGSDNTETITVTAYGLGVRLKDGVVREVFIERDLSVFGEASTQRKINLIALSNDITKVDWTVSSKAAGATGPAILISLTDGTASLTERLDIWAYFPGVDLGEVRYDFIAPAPGGLGAAVNNRLLFSTDDLATTTEGGTIHHTTAEANQSVKAPSAGFSYVYIFMNNTNVAWVGPSTGDTWGFANIRFFGRHGLSPVGTAPNEGFTVDQMVASLVGRVAGIRPRRIDAQGFVIEKAAFYGDSHEAAILELNKYEGCAFGTWGPDSPLDAYVGGNFDYVSTEPQTKHWVVPRGVCDSHDLHSESSTLYSAVDVAFTDAAGVDRVVRVTVDSPDLDAAGLTRIYSLSIGVATTAIAEARGQAFLETWGQYAPARGSFTVSEPVRHYRRGRLSPLYFRADGANVRMPDILPASTLFALDSTPDLRTTFPIKRVTVDLSRGAPAATVEVDQADDTLSVLQARSDLATSFVPSD